MALDPAVLLAELTVILDKDDPAHVPPATPIIAGQNWAKAMRTYFEGAGFPPAPPTVIALQMLPVELDAIEQATAAAIGAALTPSLTFVDAMAAIDTGMTTFASGVALARSSLAPNTVVVPPTVPPTNAIWMASTLALFLPPPAPPVPASASAAALASAWDLWFRTGTVIIPPAGPVFWA